MASIFSHAIAAVAIGKTFPKAVTTVKVLTAGAICSMLPDADVIAFSLDIPYEHALGHRGFTHSIFFAVILALVVAYLFFKELKTGSRNWWLLVLFIFLVTMSHGMLDAMTTGGRGVGFFIPFDDTRHFFPWRPIKVSPIGVSNFFSEWGLRVIKSELVYVVLPCLVFMGVARVLRRKPSP